MVSHTDTTKQNANGAADARQDLDPARPLLDQYYKQYQGEYAPGKRRFISDPSTDFSPFKAARGPWAVEAAKNGNGNGNSHHRWTDSFVGNMGVQFASRALLGAAFATFGTLAQRGYDPRRVELYWKDRLKGSHELEDIIGRDLAEATPAVHRYVLFPLAKTFDVVFGKPISYVAGAVARGYGTMTKNREYGEELGKWVAERIIFFRNRVNISPVAIEEANRLFYDELWRLNKDKGCSHFPKDFKGYSVAQKDNYWREYSYTHETRPAKERLQLPVDKRLQLVAPLQGMSLGTVMVLTTFDFAMGSVGHSLGNYICSAFDPHTKKPWRDKDGHFSWKEWGHNLATGAWEVFAKRQGEDWIAALPYVYQREYLHRQVLPGIHDGAKHTLDQGRGGFHVDLMPQGRNYGARIVGDYADVSALDYQFRFTWYNWYTLMHRDLYHHLGHAFSRWKQHHFGADYVGGWLGDKLGHPIHTAAETAKYLGDSFIKSTLYMMPVTPLFWMWKVPQDKYNSLFIGKDGPLSIQPTVKPHKQMEFPLVAEAYGEKEGLRAFYHPAIKISAVPPTREGEKHLFSLDADRDAGREHRKNAVAHGNGDNGELRLYSRQGEVMTGFEDFVEHYSPRRQSTDPDSFDPYNNAYVAGRGQFTNGFSQGLNVLGRSNRWIGEKVYKGFNTLSGIQIAGRYPFAELGDLFLRNTMGPNYQKFYNAPRRASFAYSNHALAYSAYMWGKGVSAGRINSPYMDASIYRMFDGIGHMSLSEISAGAKDFWNVIVHKPVSYATFVRAYDPRGLMNSTQVAKDQANQRDFGEEGFYDRVNHVWNTRAGIEKPITVSHTSEKPADIVIHEDAPRTSITVQNDGKILVDVARMQPDSPSHGATIH